MSDHIPKDLRQLRACLSCSLVKVRKFLMLYYSNIKIYGIFQSMEQFETDGCDNCDVFLHMKSNREAVYDCTSGNFDGMVASCKPEDSWVCKWQRITKFKPGVYAISVSGRLPQDIIRQMVSHFNFKLKLG